MKYSLRKLKNKNLFKRHKYPSPDALNIKYFGTLSYNHWVFLVSLNSPILKFKKNGMPKKRLDVTLRWPLTRPQRRYVQNVLSEPLII